LSTDATSYPCVGIVAVGDEEEQKTKTASSNARISISRAAVHEKCVAANYDATNKAKEER
jgi:hypothetical protein